MRSEEWRCGAQVRKRREFLKLVNALSKLAALLNLCAAFHFDPLPPEGGGPEGRGLGEEAAKRV